MATLDRRLIPFLEMLTEEGLDWLAFELIDGIRRGREPEEAPEALADARELVQTGAVHNGTPGDAAASVGSAPILGDDQLAWVAGHVERRLAAALVELSASLENLDSIGLTP